MAMLPDVIVTLKADASKLQAGLGDAKKQMEGVAKDGASAWDKVKASASAYGTAVGAAMLGAGAALEKLSGPLERANAQLKQAVENSGHDWNDFRVEIDKTIKTQENYGHTSADTQQALQKLTSALGDPAKALADMGMAADLAAVKHVSLADAAGLIVKMTAGSAKVFKEFGINLKDYGTGADAAAVASEVLKGKLAGMADVTAETFSGKMEMVKTKVVDFAASVGTKLVPVLTTLGPLLMGVSQALPLIQKGFALLSGAMLPVALAVGSLVAVWAIWHAEGQRDKKLVDDLKTSMDQLGGSAEQVATTKLTDYISKVKRSGDVMAATGITAQEMADALNGNRDSYNDVNNKLEMYERHLQGTGNTTDGLLGATRQLHAEFDAQKKAIDGVNKSAADMAAADAQNKRLQEALAEAAMRTTAQYLLQRQKKADLAAADELANAAMARDAAKLEEEQKRALAGYEQDARDALSAVKKSNDEAAKSYQDHQAAVSDLAGVLGDKSAQMVLSIGYTDAEIKGITTSFEKMDQAVSKGFDSMDSAVAKFGTQTNVTARDVEKFYKDQVKNAQEWEGTVKKLLQSGLNDDIITPLIEAGPKANALAKATLEEAAKQGPGILNALDNQAKQARDATVAAVNDAKVKVIAAGNEINHSIGLWGKDFPSQGTFVINVTGSNIRKFADGGWTGPGSGNQVAGVVHANEFVLSQKMLSGRQSVPSAVAAAVGGGGPVVYLTINAGMGTDPAALGRYVKDALRADYRINGAGTGSPILV